MMNLFKRIKKVIGYILLITTICTIVPMLFLEPVYWLLIGRSYFDDVLDLTGIE
jgi:O-antigen/teichoic acid export membrane protein